MSQTLNLLLTFIFYFFQCIISPFFKISRHSFFWTFCRSLSFWLRFLVKCSGLLLLFFFLGLGSQSLLFGSSQFLKFLSSQPLFVGHFLSFLFFKLKHALLSQNSRFQFLIIPCSFSPLDQSVHVVNVTFDGNGFFPILILPFNFLVFKKLFDEIKSVVDASVWNFC